MITSGVTATVARGPGRFLVGAAFGGAHRSPGPEAARHPCRAHAEGARAGSPDAFVGPGVRGPVTRWAVVPQPSNCSSVAFDGARRDWRSRATSSAAPSTRTAFCQVSLATSVDDQPRSRSSAIRFG